MGSNSVICYLTAVRSVTYFGVKKLTEVSLCCCWSPAFLRDLVEFSPPPPSNTGETTLFKEWWPPEVRRVSF